MAYDVNTIMDQARIDSQTSIANYPNTLSIIHLNEIYQEVCDEIKSLNENYFKSRITYDTVPFQNSYIFVNATSTTLSFEKMLNLAIKYQSDKYPDFQANHAYNAGELITRTIDGLTYRAKIAFTSTGSFVSGDRQQVFIGYVDAKEQSFYNQFVDNYNIGSNNPGFPLIGQYERSPVYMVVNNGFNIYPYVEQPIKQGIVIDYIQTTIDLVVGGLESSILIERNYLRLLKYGLVWKSYQYQKLINEKNDAYMMYQREKKKMLDLISNRSYNTQEVETPTLYNLM